MFIDLTLQEYLKILKSDKPVPGGGSVAPYVAALGASLSIMGANLTINKKSYELVDNKSKEIFEKNMKEINENINTLASLMDKDSLAFEKVISAFKLPKNSSEEKLIRDEKIQEGYKFAIEVPMQCLSLCFNILKKISVFITFFNKNLLPDVGAAALLLHSSLKICELNINTNLNAINDSAFTKKIKEELNQTISISNNIKKNIMMMIKN